MKHFKYLLFPIFVIYLWSCNSPKVDEINDEIKPNIIFILADDLGYGDLGITGQTKIETPYLDRLAKEGMLFTNHYTGTTVCAPSRSALLTGLHTGHTPVRGNFEVQPEGQYPLPDTLMTLPRAMKNAGYVTGAFGKWGLGFVGTSGDPNNQGFDQFFGYNCQRYAHRYYPEYLWENDQKVYLRGNDWTKKETYAPEIIHGESLKFIESNKENPFFMFVPMVIPHAELAVEQDEVFEKYRNRFGDEKEHIAPAGGDYGPDMNIPGYQSVKFPRATYATMVENLDRQVGEIIEKLEMLGIRENTIIVFASDNGPHFEGGNEPDFFNSNGIYRGYKRDLYEGGIKTPLIVNWPNKIKAGSTTDHISAFWDLMPTFLELSGKKIDVQIDGISLAPTLLGKPDQIKHDYLYWEFVEQGGKQAIRKGDWKALRLNLKNEKNPPIELYNLKDDPYESINIAESHPEIIRQMEVIFKEAHVPNTVFKLFE
ncbi:arylsulfatase [Aquiflexum sp.]|uniref:arylsulfatase n=1 Tax=Aquiflexum sp. TaxID=1872584 RepID=UPI003593CB62